MLTFIKTSEDYEKFLKTNIKSSLTYQPIEIENAVLLLFLFFNYYYKLIQFSLKEK